MSRHLQTLIFGIRISETLTSQSSLLDASAASLKNSLLYLAGGEIEGLRLRLTGVGEGGGEIARER